MNEDVEELGQRKGDKGGGVGGGGWRRIKDETSKMEHV